MQKIILSLLSFAVLISCSRGTETEKSNIELDINNAVVQQIFNFQNKRNTQSLLPFLTVENPSHRYIAAMALASVQDTSAIKDLADLLKDDYEEVRYAAAYALGMTKNLQAAQYLATAFASDSSRLVQAGILEAIGRCGTEEHLKYMCTAAPYPIQDSVLLEGQALGIYRFALRGIVHKEGTTKIMNDFIANALMPAKARFIAANYLARTKGIDLTGYENVLINNVQGEKDIYTLLPLITALAKTKSKVAYENLKTTYYTKRDYRVKCNVIRGLSNFEYDSVKTLAFEAIKDTNQHVQYTAAEYLLYNGTDEDTPLYYEWANSSPIWQIKTTLWGASLRNMSYFKTKTKAFYSQKIIEEYKKSENVYEKAAILKALANFSWNYNFINAQIFPASDTVKVPEIIRSNGAEALTILRGSPLFSKDLGLSKVRVMSDLNAIFKKCIEKGDPAMQAVVADFFTNEEMGFREFFQDVQFLKEAQSRLSLPGSIETYITLQKAINFLSGTDSPIEKKSTAFTDIDWPLLKVLKNNHKIVIRTNKGNIVLQLKADAAPATVTQFVHLAKAKYYNDKTFHRVVPNFVVQGGCSRGDGWSGFDVTVVSEFNNRLRYHEEGWVGMASAGKDTESAQFFITHVPTPHLDDNYTIFAKVVEGMNIVHQLQIGDKIISIDIN